MPKYEVSPHFVPAGTTIEADDAEQAIEYAMQDAQDLMMEASNWDVTEVSDDDS